MTTTVSHSPNTSGTSCSTSTMVEPVTSWSWRSSGTNASASRWAMPAVGSSSSSSRGRASTTEARSTTRRVPVESCAMRWWRKRSRPNAPITSSTARCLSRSTPSGPGHLQRGRDHADGLAGVAGEQQRVLDGQGGIERAVLEGADHARARSAPRAGSRPGRPRRGGWRRSVNGTRPLIASSSVVLPEPFGPISPTIAPGSVVSETPSSGAQPAEGDGHVLHVERAGRARRSSARLLGIDQRVGEVVGLDPRSGSAAVRRRVRPRPGPRPGAASPGRRGRRSGSTARPGRRAGRG